MKIYYFDPGTGEFKGEGVADSDPLVPVGWLVPYDATAVAPPEDIPEGNAARWTGQNEWEVVPDLRGTQYWIGADGHSITALGETVPDGASTEAPPHQPTSADVNAERSRRELAGKSFTPAGYGSLISVAGDSTTKTNLLALATAANARISAGDTATITPYRDADNEIHQLTPTQVFDLWAQGAAYLSALYEASWAIKDDPDGIPVEYAADGRWPV